MAKAKTKKTAKASKAKVKETTVEAENTVNEPAKTARVSFSGRW